MRFEWDERKNRLNQSKHGISFEEAQTALGDEYGILIDDEDEHDEERFLFLGMSAMLRTLVVCHCYRFGNEVVRIISARRATAHETRSYENRWAR